MLTELNLSLPNGGILHAYDTGGEDRFPVLWHHGTPNLGHPPEPLFAAADRLGLRWISYDRPGYGGSTREPGRQIGSAATYAAVVADALSLERFATAGHSGGGSHALGAAALLGDRVAAVVTFAAMAPHEEVDFDWFAGMVPSGVASLTAARHGLEAKEAYETSGVEYDPEFTAADEAMFDGPWGWLGSVAGPPALLQGPGGLVDDDLAYLTAWGCDLAQITAPTLVVQGGQDGIAPPAYGEWIAGHCPHGTFHPMPEDGHISVLRYAEPALDWLRDRIDGR